VPTLTPLEFPIPAETTAVYAGNVDTDPQDELILSARYPAGDAPDKVRLTILHFTTSGTLEARVDIELGNKASLWDTGDKDHGGLFVQDKDGILSYTGATPTRIVQHTTPLSVMGPTTPVHAEFVRDITGDKQPEFILYSSGRLRFFGLDGSELGTTPATAEGRLGSSWATGAQGLTLSLLPPPFLAADVDGDGIRDLLLPSKTRAQVAFGGAQPGARGASLSLPLDLEPRDTPLKPGETRREILAVWFEDIDNDKKIDLVVERLVSTGSFFGSTAEFLVARGTGTGFSSLPTLTTPSAAFGVELVDFDGDGDLDLLVPEVDVGMGNLARALVSKVVQISLKLYRFESGGYSSPTTIRVANFPFEQDGRFQLSMTEDFDGDGKIDLITNDGEDRVRVYRGTGTGLESTVAWDTPLKVPLANNSLFAHDLTGDGKAEIIVWGPGETTAKLLRAP
jgi:hypothetical protein